MGVGLFSLISIVILFWPYYSLTLKRLEDRGRTPVPFWVLIGPSVLSGVLTMFGISGSMGHVELFGQMTSAFEPNTIVKATSFIAVCIGLWALVELGFLRGRPDVERHETDTFG